MNNTNRPAGLRVRPADIFERTADGFDCRCCGTFVTRPVFLRCDQGDLGAYGTTCAAKFLGYSAPTSTATRNRIANDVSDAAARQAHLAERAARAALYLEEFAADTDAISSTSEGLRIAYLRTAPDVTLTDWLRSIVAAAEAA